MRFGKILSLFIIVVMGLAPISKISAIPSRTTLDGYIDTEVPNPAVNVGNLQDNAYTYTGADVVVYDYNIHIDDYVTIVVIDDGLYYNEWKALEQNPEANVDIIGFVTETSTGYIKWINSPDDPYLNYQTIHGHGFAVISAIAAVARGVEVIFFDLDATEPFWPYRSDSFGFEFGEYKIWNWINIYQYAFDIDIVTWSGSSEDDFATSSILQKWDSLISKGVIMISSAGNAGNYLNTYGENELKYPQYYTDWYCVGSIDHETRSGESTKNEKSEFSSWYLSSTSGNHIVNWLMPGNGIPVLTSPYYDLSLQCYRGHWKYADGTSFSTPYLAAVIALILTGYHNGIGSYTDPSVQKVVDILQYASSRSTFDQEMGYGYIDVYNAYGKAYTEGRLAA